MKLPRPTPMPAHSSLKSIDIATEALAAHNADLRVLPPSEDGTKRPMEKWKAAQTTRPTIADILRWYGPRSGLGVVCGAISGQLEVLDFDCHETYLEFLVLARETGLDNLVERIESGYLEETPSGGRHWLYRCDVVSGNTKLAQRLNLPDEMANSNDRLKPLIETRGEGGYVIIAPSNGPHGADSSWVVEMTENRIPWIKTAQQHVREGRGQLNPPRGAETNSSPPRRGRLRGGAGG